MIKKTITKITKIIKKIKFQQLILLIAVIAVILAVFYFTTQKTAIFKKEKFDNIINNVTKTIDRKNKTCSQDSINTNIKDYVFSSVPSTR
jgi:hypothetical protein